MSNPHDFKGIVPPPKTFEELCGNLNAIMGKNLEELALKAGIPLPISATHGKGFIGELMEILLGASASNHSIPDFPQLGLELKTLPVDAEFKVMESTFLCHAPLTDIRGLTFENSPLFSKIKRVLFIVIDGTRDRDYALRKVLGYFFYSPDEKELETLRKDYDELYELIKTGQVDRITAHIGQIIQLRPKGANGKALCDAIGADGETIKTRPRGFYIRRRFTQELLRKNLQYK